MLEFSCDRDYLSGKLENYKTFVVSILLEYFIGQVC